MTKSEDFNLESLISTAQKLGPDKRSQFLLLFPVETRVAIMRCLDSSEDGADRTIVEELDDQQIQSAATLVVEPTVAKEKDLEIRDLDYHCSKTLVDDLDAANQFGSASKAGRHRLPGKDFADHVSGSSDQRTGVHLVKLHARGAIGEVYVAYDEKLSREVAIKRIRPELPANQRRVRRFLREAIITAKLQHPGIVPVYTMGGRDGTPHYTMPLVSGSTMTELIKDTHKELRYVTSPQKWMSAMRPLLRNFIAACNAIDYAHTENIVHRDLKPSNILIGSRGQTMVVDWGCAKDIDDLEDRDLQEVGVEINEEVNEEINEEVSEEIEVNQSECDCSIDSSGDSGSQWDVFQIAGDITLLGSVMGTVEFMSPEQAAGKNNSVGKHSDVFGLGATLFSLLTNHRTIEFDSGQEIRAALQKVKHGQFRRIEEIDSRVPPAIAAICQRAMALEPEDRYATVGALGRDVEAFLAGDVVEAHEEPFHERMMRFFRRHQTLVTTLLGILTVGFISMIAINLFVNSQKTRLAALNRQLVDLVNVERDLRNRANRSEDFIKQQLYGNEMLLASEASTEAGGLGRMRELVSNWSAEDYAVLRGWEWLHLRNLGNRELWTLDDNITANQIITTRDSDVARVFDRVGSEILAIDMKSQKPISRESVSSDCSVVDFNEDQSQIVEGHRDGRVTVRFSSSGLSDDAKVDTEIAQHHQHAAPVRDVKWNVGGDLVASCDEQGKVVVWHVGDQEVVGRGEDALGVLGKGVLAWSFDGHHLFWTTSRQIRRLNLATKEIDDVVADDWITDPCNSHEGELLAYVGPENSIVVADVQGNVLHRFEGHQLFIESLYWHPEKHLLLSGSADGTARIWDADTKKEIRQLLGHEGHVYSAAWNSSGTRVFSGGFPEDALRLWDVSDIGKEAFDRELQDRPALDWHPTGESLVVAEGKDLVIQTTDGDFRWLRAQDPASPNLHGVDFHPTQELIACVGSNGKIWTVDARTGEVKTVYDSGSGGTLFPTITSRGVQWSPDGNYLAGVGGNGELHVWDVADGSLVSESVAAGRILSVAWSPIDAAGEQRLAAVGTGNDFVIFEPATEKIVRRLVQHGWKTGLAWSPDGKQLAVNNRRSVNVWDIDDGVLVEACDGPSAMILEIDWSSTQDRFAALTEDGKICIWNGHTRTYLAKFALHTRSPYCLRWSPDGQRLVSTTRYGRIVFQDIAKQ